MPRLSKIQKKKFDKLKNSLAYAEQRQKEIAIILHAIDDRLGEMKERIDVFIGYPIDNGYLTDINTHNFGFQFKNMCF